MDAVEIVCPPLKINQKCSTVTCLQKSGEIIYKSAKFLMFILSGFSSPSSNAKGRISNPDRRRRWSSLAKPALGVALAMGVLGAGQAQAFVVTVGGQDWDVTTFTGNYIVNTSKFGLPPAPGVMPWWGSASLAQQFVAATGGNLGSPPQTQGFSAPFFGYEQDVNVPTVTWAYSYFSGGPFPINADPITDEPTWAQATLLTPPAAPVPVPLPALGAAAAFGFSRKLRKRIKINKGSSATFTLL